jgi:hypothetical protein
LKQIGLVAIAAADAVVSKDVAESEKIASPNSNSTQGRFN